MNYKTEQEKQDKEFDERFYELMGLETDPNGTERIYLIRDENGTILNGIDFTEEQDELKSYLLTRDTALLEAFKKDVREMKKDCPHDSHSHCMEEMCWIHEDGGYNQAIQDISSLLKDYNLNK